MAGEELGNLGLTSGWETGEEYWGGPMNENLLMLDTVINLVVEAGGVNAPPPEGVADGTVYAIGSNPVGEWLGQAGKLAIIVEGAWKFYQPKDGWRARFKSLGRFMYYDGVSAKWLSEASGSDPSDPTTPDEGALYYDMSVYVPEDVQPNEVVVHFPLTSPMLLPENMRDSVLDAINPPDVNRSLLVYRNNILVGWIQVAAGNFNATFITINGTAILFQIGDRLTIKGDEGISPSFKQFGFTLRFNLVR